METDTVCSWELSVAFAVSMLAPPTLTETVPSLRSRTGLVRWFNWAMASPAEP